MKKFLVSCFIWLSAVGCGGGSNVVPGPAPVNPSNPGTADEAKAAGLSAFRNRDLVGARDAFCKELPDEPEDSRLAFGCFWAKWMLLPTSSEAATLLAVFDEEALLPEIHFYGSEGVFTRIGEVDRAQDQIFPEFNYGHFKLPFNQFDPTFTVQSILLNRAVANGVSAPQVQGMIEDLIPPLEQLAALGSVFLADSAFTFSLPKELFNLSSDLAVTPNDAALFLAGVEGTIFLYQLVTAYDFGLEIHKVAFPTFLDDDALLEDLNGSGATIGSTTFDTVSFLTLIDRGRIAGSKPHFLRACTLAKGALERLEAGEASTLFSAARGERSMAEPISLLADLIASLDGPTAIQSLSSHSLSLDLGKFFANPPDAAALGAGAGDPFVLEDGAVVGVESYFKTLLDGIAEF